MKSKGTAFTVSIALLACLVTSVGAQTSSGPHAVRSEDGTWTTRRANDFLARVRGLQGELAAAAGDQATCLDEPRICNEMQNALIQVYENTYYVFHGNTDFNRQCLRGRLGIVQGIASEINYWNDWLWARYKKLGLADMAHQISQYAHWPLCPGARRAGGGTTGGSTGGNTGGGGGTGGGGTTGGSGITTNTSKLALNGARACQNANLTYGRHWIFDNPNNSLSRGEYYEHDGYLCHKNGTAFYVMGSPYLAFSCSANWSGCVRNKGSDGYVSTTTQTVTWGNQRYNKGKIKWASGGYSDWDVYQGWWN